jgi:hypothetical protein
MCSRQIGFIRSVGSGQITKLESGLWGEIDGPDARSA